MKNNKGLSALAPGDRALMHEAESLVVRHEFLMAISIYDRIISDDPQGYVFAKRGYAKFEIGNFVGAVSDFNFAISSKPDSPVTLRFRAKSKEVLGDLPGALEDYRNSLVHLERADTHRDIAMILEYQGKVEAALTEYRAALELDSTDEVARSSIEALVARR